MEQIRCRNMVSSSSSSSSSFHSTVYKEIEEIGWENLLSLSEDLRLLSILIPDKRGKVYTLEILLDETHPKGQPSLAADVPHMFDVDWSKKSTIKDVVHQFLEHVDKLGDLWSTLDNIDQCLWVVDPKDVSHSILHRQIKIEDSCSLVLSINADDPRSLPECRFIGSDPEVNTFRDTWRRNCKKWRKDNHVSENLAVVLETQLPGPPSNNHKNEQQVECGICYAQCLPFDDELGDKSGSETDYTCENGNCNRSFHTICLEDWLRSISSTRQSFDVLFGTCPYCSDPVAVKINPKRVNF
ncbi:E3 ubiquitin-protein ligase FANCL isoform X2 [Impatiens glandulifera]|nr:E3 ubiquitin-protein ligase FANCL isoform X2 [Impatiens glandulifera]